MTEIYVCVAVVCGIAIGQILAVFQVKAAFRRGQLSVPSYARLMRHADGRPWAPQPPPTFDKDAPKILLTKARATEKTSTLPCIGCGACCVLVDGKPECTLNGRAICETCSANFLATAMAEQATRIPKAPLDEKKACEHGIEHFQRDGSLWGRCPYCGQEAQLRRLDPDERDTFPKEAPSATKTP